MPTCTNCGAHVTAEYVRVMSRRDEDEVRACPDCPDMIRVGDEVREKRT